MSFQKKYENIFLKLKKVWALHTMCLQKIWYYVSFKQDYEKFDENFEVKILINCSNTIIWLVMAGANFDTGQKRRHLGLNSISNSLFILKDVIFNYCILAKKCPPKFLMFLRSILLQSQTANLGLLEAKIIASLESTFFPRKQLILSMNQIF